MHKILPILSSLGFGGEKRFPSVNSAEPDALHDALTLSLITSSGNIKQLLKEPFAM
jgi:hypothetical protein